MNEEACSASIQWDCDHFERQFNQILGLAVTIPLQETGRSYQDFDNEFFGVIEEFKNEIFHTEDYITRNTFE